MASKVSGWGTVGQWSIARKRYRRARLEQATELASCFEKIHPHRAGRDVQLLADLPGRPAVQHLAPDHVRLGRLEPRYSRSPALAVLDAEQPVHGHAVRHRGELPERI